MRFLVHMETQVETRRYAAHPLFRKAHCLLSPSRGCQLDAQEGLAYRDIPQTTYNRLIASGAGEKTPNAAQARGGGHGKAKKDASCLLSLDSCETLLYTLPAGLRETLLPFQRDGVLYGLRRKGRCLIADEMGTGKVGTAMVMLYTHDAISPYVVLPNAMVGVRCAGNVVLRLSPSKV